MNNLNLNIDQQTLEACLKNISNFGSTTYQNICTGASNTVPWGALDWGILIVGGLVILIGVVGLGRVLYEIFFY